MSIFYILIIIFSVLTFLSLCYYFINIRICNKYLENTINGQKKKKFFLAPELYIKVITLPLVCLLLLTFVVSGCIKIYPRFKAVDNVSVNGIEYETSDKHFNSDEIIYDSKQLVKDFSICIYVDGNDELIFYGLDVIVNDEILNKEEYDLFCSDGQWGNTKYASVNRAYFLHVSFKTEPGNYNIRFANVKYSGKYNKKIKTIEEIDEEFNFITLDSYEIKLKYNIGDKCIYEETGVVNYAFFYDINEPYYMEFIALLINNEIEELKEKGIDNDHFERFDIEDCNHIRLVGESGKTYTPYEYISEDVTIYFDFIKSE